MLLTENDEFKHLRSLNYNFSFNKKTGYFARWGRTLKDDPEYSPFGPEILDIEVSTICSRACDFCYKTNYRKGETLGYDCFKQIFRVMPKTLTQIAFGIGDIDAAEDLFDMMKFARDRGVIPNITINGERMTNAYYRKLVRLCGAVSVSLYDKDTCYDAVQELTKRGLEQVNIHCLLSKETLSMCQAALRDRLEDPRLEKLNAIVFLSLKQKGRGKNYSQLTNIEDLRNLLQYAYKKNIGIGFDSCSGSNVLNALRTGSSTAYNMRAIEYMIEPCESTLFSYYINNHANGFPCSFSEQGKGWDKGIPMLNLKSESDFLNRAWHGEETTRFRQNLLQNKDCNGCRMCPIYDLRLSTEERK